MQLFRIHIRPKGGSSDMEATFRHCLDNKVLGVGWRTKSDKNTKDWDEYYQQARIEYSDLSQCEYIRNYVDEGDLVWTRDSYGDYYLAKVTSGWEYWTNENSRALDLDIANIFRCEILKVAIDDVPGKVVACFRARRSMQKVDCKKTSSYSSYLWRKLKGEEICENENSDFKDIFMMLDDQETEDLVFLFLQQEGWRVVPNSRQSDTMKFEYLCVCPETGKKALTQVKTGDSAIDRDEYSNRDEKIFLFQSNDRYSGNGHPEIEQISRSQLENFLRSESGWLPGVFSKKMEMVGLK